MKPEIENAAMLGGKEITVTDHDGKARQVKVLALPLRLIPRYLELQFADAEQALAELFIGWDEAAVDSLTDESILEILLEGERLNFPRAEAFVNRKKERIKKALPLIETVEALIVEHVVAQIGPALKDEILEQLKVSGALQPARPLPSGPVKPKTSESKVSPG